MIIIYLVFIFIYFNDFVIVIVFYYLNDYETSQLGNNILNVRFIIMWIYSIILQYFVYIHKYILYIYIFIKYVSVYDCK